MTATAPLSKPARRIRLGILLVAAGLLAQAVAAFFWSPGGFVLSAALGVPLVLGGALLAVIGVEQSRRLQRRSEAGP